jgi:hypothetical protein
MGSGAQAWVAGILVWLAVIGLARLAGLLAAQMRQHEAELAELAELPAADLAAPVVWTDDQLDRLIAELHTGHRFEPSSWAPYSCAWLAHPQADRCGRPRRSHPRG